MEWICVPSDGEPKYPSFVYIFSSHLSLADTSKKISDPSLTTAATPQSLRPPTAATHSPPKLHRRRNIPSTSEEHTISRFRTNSRDESTAVGGSDVKKVVVGCGCIVIEGLVTVVGGYGCGGYGRRLGRRWRCVKGWVGGGKKFGGWRSPIMEI